MKILKKDLVKLYKESEAENKILWEVLKNLKIRIDIKEAKSMYSFGYITQSIRFEGNGECVGVCRELLEDIQELKRNLLGGNK